MGADDLMMIGTRSVEARSPLVAGRMARLARVLVTALVAVSCVSAASGAGAASWGGRWRLDARQSPGLYDGPTFTLRQRGARLVGSFSWQFRAERGFGGASCATGHGGTLTATIKRRTATGTLIYPAREGHRRFTASFEATLSANQRRLDVRGQSITGECGAGIGYVLVARRVAG